MTDTKQWMDKLQFIKSVESSSSEEERFCGLAYAIYKTVEKNPSVSENKVVWSIQQQFNSLSTSKIRDMVTLLKDRRQKCLKTWHTKKVCHLHPNLDFKVKCEAYEKEYPHFSSFSPVDIKTANDKNSAQVADNETI